MAALLTNLLKQNIMITEAKNIFYRSLEGYEKASPECRKQMIQDIKKKQQDRICFSGEDCYTLASKWFIRLEDYLNKTI